MGAEQPITERAQREASEVLSRADCEIHTLSSWAIADLHDEIALALAAARREALEQAAETAMDWIPTVMRAHGRCEPEPYVLAQRIRALADRPHQEESDGE